MNVGIYIPGLGQSFARESVEKYAGRLMNQMSYNTNGISYALKTEQVNYSEKRSSMVVSIVDKNDSAKVFYKLYDYQYNEILTARYKNYSLLFKNVCLLMLVVTKLPLLIKRLLYRGGYSRPFQTLYLFLIFLVIAAAILFMLPTTILVVTDMVKYLDGHPVLAGAKVGDVVQIESQFQTLSKLALSLTAVTLLVLPNANVWIGNLATEFVCVNGYLERGTQQQSLMGNLEGLVEYICENETDCKIHFHTYSFGSIVALDYLYPISGNISKNAINCCNALITIGTPFEFIKSYYPAYYKKRILTLDEKICWLNVYSVADALATNFRDDSIPADAQFGIQPTSAKPVNINYEVAAGNSKLTSFLSLYSIKVHGMYWDSKIEGQSCLSNVYAEMTKRNLLAI